MTVSDDEDTSATPGSMEVLSVPAERRGRRLRRLGLLAFTGFVLLGASGQLGIRTVTTEGSDGDLHVSLVHARVARPALAVPFRLTITRPGGFDGQIEVRTSTSYIEAMDENGFSPDPDRMSTDSDDTIWWFDPPEGDVLVIWLDTRVEPGVQWRRSGTTTVTSGDDVVTIEHPIWILP